MYSKLYDSFWQDLKRKKVSQTGKVLFLYLISCPHHNLTGLYHLPYAYVSSDLCMGSETVSEGFYELIEKGFIAYDEEAEMVLIRHFLRYNPLDNPNVEKKAVAVVRELPETTLFQAFVDVMGEYREQYPNLFETVSERYANTVTYSCSYSVTKDLPPLPQDAPARDENLGRVMAAYLDKINPTPSERSLDELKGYAERMGAETCLRAIDRALDAGSDKANWNYIRGILRSLHQQGVRCLADWDKLDEERERRKHGDAENAGGSGSQDTKWKLPGVTEL